MDTATTSRRNSAAASDVGHADTKSPATTVVFIAPHTHWDRAWYIPFEELRIRLVHLVDQICDVLEQNPAFSKFSLDGQTVVLEDYLAIRPQMRERLARLTASGRLLVGPWYVLPDEFLVSGESLVRNLMIGHRISQEFGRTMNVGYVPDPFGHIAQLPQILRGFGHDTFIFSRGIDIDESDLKVEFSWQGPDGSSLLALHQRFFYNNAAFLGYRIFWGDTDHMIRDDALAVHQIRKACDDLASHSHTSVLLLNNGVDHSRVQPELPRLVEKASAEMPGYALSIASLEEYAQAARQQLEGVTLQIRKGELIYPYGDLLHGVYSSRAYLKTLNRHCQDLLEQQAEPVAASAWMTGSAPYPADILAYAWRELLKNHPHDDICGCSCDQVHREMEHRFGVVDQVGMPLVRDAIRALSHRVDVTAQEGVPILVFNPLGNARKDTIRIPVDLCSYDEPWKSFAIYDETGAEIPHHRVRHESVHWMETLKAFSVERHHVELDLELPALGYRVLYVREGKPRKPVNVTEPQNPAYENDYYRLDIHEDGSLHLFDKATESAYDNLLTFEDMEDCGDEYNWSYLQEHSRTVMSKDCRPRISCVYTSPFSTTWKIVHKLKVPETLSGDRRSRSRKTVVLEIETRVTCRRNSPRIDFVTRLTNTAKDHRLRVLFPTDIETDSVCADSHFAVVERSVLTPPAKKVYPPYTTQHQKRFAVLTDGLRGFGVINDGMPEFEVLCEPGRRTFALTLFRSVGWLSRHDLVTRPGLVGPEVFTPDAQCLRTMEFRYAIMGCKGGWDAVLLEALHHNVNVIATRCDIHSGTDPRHRSVAGRDPYIQAPPREGVPREGDLPEVCSFVDLGNERLVLSAAKKCDHRDTFIVRFYNPGATGVTGALRSALPIQEAHEVTLNEVRKHPMSMVDGAVPFECGPYKIMTVELAFSSTTPG